MNKGICIVAGVGEATGSAIVRRFAENGYKVAMIARNHNRLSKITSQIENTYSYPCDISNIDNLAKTITKITNDLGLVNTLIHNAVSHTFGKFLESDPTELERNFRVNTTSLLYMARQLVPQMILSKEGTIIATGNTASFRGIPNYALFAPTKAAQRILCESLARDLGPKGIHVGYIAIDAAIDAEWLGATDEERPSWLVPPKDWPFRRDEYFANPCAIADEVYHMAHQHRSAWAFETTIRPFAEYW